MQINIPRNPYTSGQPRPKAPAPCVLPKTKLTPNDVQSLLHPPKPTLIGKIGNLAGKTIDNVTRPLAGLALLMVIPTALVTSQEEGKAQRMEMELLHKAPDKVGYLMKKGNEYQAETGFAGNILASRQNFYSSVLDSIDGGKSTPLTTFFKAAKR